MNAAFIVPVGTCVVCGGSVPSGTWPDAPDRAVYRDDSQLHHARCADPSTLAQSDPLHPSNKRPEIHTMPTAMYDPHLDRTLGDVRRLAAASITTNTNEATALLAMLDAPTALTMTELGRRIPLSRAAVTTLVDRLEDAGHLTRELFRGDRRRIHLVLTPTGRQWIEGALTLDLTDLDS